MQHTSPFPPAGSLTLPDGSLGLVLASPAIYKPTCHNRLATYLRPLLAMPNVTATTTTC